jgi:hypothetical protein
MFRNAAGHTDTLGHAARAENAPGGNSALAPHSRVEEWSSLGGKLSDPAKGVSHHHGNAGAGDTPFGHDHTPARDGGHHGEGDWESAGSFLTGRGLGRARHAGREAEDAHEPRWLRELHSHREQLRADRAEDVQTPGQEGADSAGEAGLTDGPREAAAHAHGFVFGPEVLQTVSSDLGERLEVARELRPRSARAEPTLTAPGRDDAPLETTPLTSAAPAPGAPARPGGPGEPDERAATLVYQLFAEPNAGRGWGWLTAAYEGPPVVEVALRRGEWRVAGVESAQGEQVAAAPAPAPVGAGLAAGALAADTTALERAVRDFLGGLDAAGRELTRVLGENSWARWAVATALAAAAAEVGRRRLRPGARHDGGACDEGSALSRLSGSFLFPGDRA